ncbi:hypothetical protein C2857_003561 [Epichloe festucae Fl1]|uniref:Acyltransferase 3 domain-containing protein n=1 Tax=Epichloe festucae (strain Fl1) TaxID=877507 RepID=A0A7S9KUT2_EPIFF|nr:hypothetical protein C2857_003561 [Epichloe festucae Fl1]
MLSCLTPSFLRGSDSNKPLAYDVRPRPRTSPLDGIRGYAALSVLNYHVLYAYQSFVFYGYGVPSGALEDCARPGDRQSHNRWLHQLPILRLVYTGTWPISIFFVLSGFALSHKPLTYLQRQDQGYAQAVAAVASGFIRRPFRLYGPPVLATLMTMLLIQWGLYEHGRSISENTEWVPVIAEVHHRRLDSFSAQLIDWFRQTSKLLRIFWWGDLYNQYDVHLWTISAEFRCSLAVFAMLPPYMALKPRVRTIFIMVLVVYVYLLERWDVALFFSGILIADTSINLHQGNATITDGKPVRQMLLTAFKLSLVALSLLLLSSPDFCVSATPATRILSYLIPSSDAAPFRFLPNLGSIILIGVIAHTPSTNRALSVFLNSAIPQYLGRISYSLYIVHGPLIHVVGYSIFQALWNLTGRENVWRYCAGFFTAYFVFLAIVVYVADIFWMAIDMPCVSMAKFLHDMFVTNKA